MSFLREYDCKIKKQARQRMFLAENIITEEIKTQKQGNQDQEQVEEEEVVSGKKLSI